MGAMSKGSRPVRRSGERKGAAIAIYDALKIFEGPILEVHISNIHARDELHRHSKLSAAATSVICGLGPYGYIVAMQAAARLVATLPDALPVPIRIGPR